MRTLSITRMHSSRMRTARSSSRREGLPQCMLGYTPWEWACRPPRVRAWKPSPGVGLEPPPSMGLETPLGVSLTTLPRPDPSTSPFGVGLETPPWPDPSTSPLGVGLETCKACWDTTCNACCDTTPL